MSRLVRAELLALRTTPTAMRLFAVALALALFLTVSYVGIRDLEHLPPGDADRGVETAVTGAFVLFFAGLVLATSPFRHGIAPQLALLAPSRGAAFAARAATLAGFGALAGLLVAAASTATVLVIVGLGGGPAPGGEVVARVFVTVPLYAALAAAAGAGLGTAVRSQPAALALGAGLAFVLDPLLSATSELAAAYGPAGAAAALVGIDDPDAPPALAALAVLVAYTALSLAAGLVASRRDL